MWDLSKLCKKMFYYYSPYLLLWKTNSHISGPPFSGPKSKHFIPGEKAEIQILRLIIVPSYHICENYLQLWWEKGQYRLQLLWLKSIHSYNKTCKSKKYFHSLEELFSLFLCEPCWKWSFPIFGYCKHEWLIFTLPIIDVESLFLLKVLCNVVCSW